MKYKKLNSTIVFFILFFCLSVTAYSQSRYLEDGIGGSSFGFDTFISADGLDAVGLSAAYSIGGKMDFGFKLNRENGTISGYDSTVWNFNFVYNLIVIKQTEYIPLSLQLESGYGFSNITSDNLSTLSISSYEGQGFNIGASIFREFNSKGYFSFLIGGKAHYTNFLYTTTNLSAVESEERKEDFFYGGIVGVSFKPARWPIFTLELEALYSQVAGGLYLQPSILIISPSF